MSDAEKLPRHVSLGILLAFTLSMGVWISVIKLCSPAVRQNVGLFGILPACVVLALIVSYYRPAISVLLLLIAGMVGGSQLLLAHQESTRERSRLARLEMLRQYSFVLQVVPLTVADYPSAENPIRTGADIHASIAENGKLPHKLPSFPVRIENGRPTFFGAEGHKLIWQVHPTTIQFVLIDTGDDGLAGNLKGNRRTITDANQDTVDDGDDDVYYIWRVISGEPQ